MQQELSIQIISLCQHWSLYSFQALISYSIGDVSSIRISNSASIGVSSSLQLEMLWHWASYSSFKFYVLALELYSNFKLHMQALELVRFCSFENFSIGARIEVSSSMQTLELVFKFKLYMQALELVRVRSSLCKHWSQYSNSKIYMKRQSLCDLPALKASISASIRISSFKCKYSSKAS